MRAKFLHAFLFLAALFLFEAALLVSCNRNTTFGCVESERHALLKFKACFNDSSHMLSSWKGNDCCEWKGVVCDTNSNHVVSLALRGETDYYFGEIHKNALIVNGSSGDDAAAFLLELRFLEHLDLSGNDFNYSYIPPSIGLMKQLRYLNLSYAGFSGRIPRQLGNLSRLCILNLQQANFYGPSLEAHDLRWISQLGSLQQLVMDGVNLTGATSPNVFQVLNNLPSLTWLSLLECGLNSSHLSLGGHPFNSTFLANIQHLDLSFNSIQVPELVFIANMTALEFLDLAYNSLVGPIPSWIGTMSTLKELHLSSNNFQGTIPSWSTEGKLFALRRLDLSDNQLSGEVANSFAHLLELEYLNLRNNQLSGSIPDSIGQLSKLETLYLSLNQLNGTISASVVRLSKLKIIKLFFNQLTGEIPTGIGQLSKLETLDLSYNQLIGAIPASVLQLSKLEIIGLSSNQLSGEIPAGIGQLSKLETLDISYNKLTGEIPASIGQLSNLQFLYVERNYLEGVVSEVHFKKLANLKGLHIGFNRLNCALKSDWRPPFHIESISLNSCKLGLRFPKWLLLQKTTRLLDLSDASISGPLPEDIGHMMPKLDYLLLANNHINGSLPKSLCNLESLMELDVSNNMFSGNIPDCWRNNELVSLNLGSNKFSGLIPPSIGQLSSLYSLCLNNNSMHGELVPLAKCTNMHFLDVGENAFSGNITWIRENLHSLQILRLRRNMFSGQIPLQLCMLSALRVLDLAKNKFRGNIPSCFQNYSCMSGGGQDCPYIANGSSGHLTEVMKGRNMEYESGPMRALATIDLSCNNLEGHIPKEIALLVALIGLNMSYNHLSGEIPGNIGQMKNLESLDLSQNSLSGTIPSSLSELSMLVHLNLSHNDLSGPIPTGNQLQNLEDITTVYIGNPLLCGLPLLTKCSEDAQPPTSTPSKSKDDNEDAREKMWFYLIVMSGFATGLWGVIGALIFMKSWRHALFRMVDNVQDKISVTVTLKMKRVKKMLNRNPDDE